MSKIIGVAEVKGDGAILIMTDDTIYEVNSIYTITTSMWLGYNDALVIDDYELINLDEADSPRGDSNTRPSHCQGKHFIP